MVSWKRAGRAALSQYLEDPVHRWEQRGAVVDLTCACSGVLCCSHFRILLPHWAYQYVRCGPRARQGHWRRGTVEFLMLDLRWTVGLRNQTERAQEHFGWVTQPDEQCELLKKNQLTSTHATVFTDSDHCKKLQRKPAIDSNEPLQAD